MALQGKIPIGKKKSVEVFLEYEIEEKIEKTDKHCTKVSTTKTICHETLLS